MARFSIPAVMVTTTADGAGYVHGVAVGIGDDPDGAIAALAAEAKRMIAEWIKSARLRQADVLGPDDWGIEVVDLRLVPGIDMEIHSPWTAYGTLRTTGLSPLAADAAGH
jgi:hypothetical protein